MDEHNSCLFGPAKFDEYGKTGFTTYENVKIKRIGDNLFRIVHGELRGELATFDILNQYYIPVDSKKFEKPWILTKVRMVEMIYSEFVDMLKEELYDVQENFKTIHENLKSRIKIIGIEPAHIREQLFNEAISSKDAVALKKIIRAELASWLFDLYKKRNIWM